MLFLSGYFWTEVNFYEGMWADRMGVGSMGRLVRFQGAISISQELSCHRLTNKTILQDKGCFQGSISIGLYVGLIDIETHTSIVVFLSSADEGTLCKPLQNSLSSPWSF